MAERPTSRTMRELRKRGMLCGVVERFNQHAGPAGIRVDLFGFIDVIAIRPRREFEWDSAILGVQCCAGSGHAAHVKKITRDCAAEAKAWLDAGGRIELWSWSKHKVKRGGKAVRWTPRIQEITQADLCPIQEPLPTSDPLSF